ncbi:MAG TPA: hypothetical protein VM867_05935, partial [Xanthobacteraceae bacterium]|nr:hypothetical protein [Xanthobacteraceae bacterium]
MAEFEELRLTVNLVDNASTGLQRIRAEIGQLTQSATQMTAGLSQASNQLTNVGKVAATTTPQLRTINQEMVLLRRSSADLGRGISQVGMSLQQGLGGLPVVAAGIKNMAGGVSGLSVSLETLAPSASNAALAIGGVAVGVV